MRPRKARMIETFLQNNFQTMGQLFVSYRTYWKQWSKTFDGLLAVAP